MRIFCGHLDRGKQKEYKKQAGFRRTQYESTTYFILIDYVFSSLLLLATRVVLFPVFLFVLMCTYVLKVEYERYSHTSDESYEFVLVTVRSSGRKQRSETRRGCVPMSMYYTVCCCVYDLCV